MVVHPNLNIIIMNNIADDNKYYCNVCNTQFDSKSWWKHVNRKTACVSSKEIIDMIRTKDLHIDRLETVAEHSNQELKKKDQEIEYLKQLLHKNDEVQEIRNHHIGQISVLTNQNALLQNVLKEAGENADKRARCSQFIITLMKKSPDMLVKFVTLFKGNHDITYADIKALIKELATKRYVLSNSKKSVYRDQGHNCAKCQLKLPISYQIDHIVPLYQGGSNDEDNLQALCPTCHSEKTVEDDMRFYYDIQWLSEQIS